MPDRRIPWPVDMRGWRKVGVIEPEADTNWSKGLEVWAKGNQRRLIEPDGPIVFSYEVKEAKDES